MKKMKRFTASNILMKNVFLLLILIGVVNIAMVPASADPYDGYLMAHFTGESSNYGEQIYFATSTDGLHWTDLNNSQPVLISNIGDGGVRDPSLIRSADGIKFWILATDLCIGCGTSWHDAMHNGSTSLVIWESADLVNWSGPWLADVAGSIPDAGCAWAPEAIYDEDNSNYVVYWATISPLGGYDKPRIYYATTTDFINFSAPQMYINRPGSQGIIDTQILKVQDSTYNYYRASADGQITFEGGNSVLGSWTYIGDISHLGLTGSDVEGPILFKFNDVNLWCLMVDQYATGGGYLPLVSDDLSDTYNFEILDSSEYSLGSSRKRHGSILNITTAELNAILEKWPPPTIYPSDVIESYNYPGYYFNHEGIGDQAYIVEDADSLDSGQWNIVPGLKDSAGISFESVEHSGHYLRHYGFVLRLDMYDGLDIFKQDATYYVRSGWADSGYDSFESYNYPGRYIRHSSLGLRVDEVDSGSSSSLKEDATFNIVITPPAAPASLTATSSIDHVSLDWDGNIESDLDSYNVYRSETSGGPYTPIQDVTVSEYLDDSVNNGTAYYYVVTATDTSGNVSGNSDEDSALPPDITDDDKIDLKDVAKVAEAWLTTYDINSLSAIVENWLKDF